ncbi:MAG: hypothetical protein R3F59_25700 [Myxococcota bacterium]
MAPRRRAHGQHRRGAGPARLARRGPPRERPPRRPAQRARQRLQRRLARLPPRLAAWQLRDEALADTRIEQLRAVTVDDVARVWRTWIVGAEPTRVHLRPERVPLAVRLFGWMVP